MIIGLGLVFVHYHWSATSSGTPFRWGERQHDYYNLLAEALLAGRLHLLVEPSPELLSLPDPYDPEANRRYRIYHDMSLYKGRYYIYFGVAPAVVLFIPFRVSGMELPQGFAAVVLMFGGVVFSMASLLLVVRRFHPETPFALVFACLVFFGFSNFAPFILRRPIVYEVAVGAGYFFLMGALYALLRGCIDGPRPAWLALGSLLLGLAAGSRPHHLLAVLLLGLVYMHAIRAAPEGEHSRWRLGLSLGLPISLCVAMLLLYNHARFGEWLEFGQTYVLSNYNQPHLKLLSLSYLPSHLFINLFSPPSVDLDFPFFHLYPSVWPELPHPRHFFDSIAGVFPCVPLTGLALFSPLLLVPRFRRNLPMWPLALAACLVALALALVAVVSCFIAASVRYFADFVPLLLLATALTWIGLRTLAKGRRAARIAVHAGLGLLLVYGTVVNLAVGLTGYWDLFRKRNPNAYAAIEDLFLPLQRLLLSVGPGYGEVRIRLRFPASHARPAEALLTAGEEGGADVLCVRYLDAERAVFKFHHAGAEPVRSRVVRLSPERTYLLEVSMGSLFPPMRARVLSRLFPGGDGEDLRRRLSVRLNGEALLSGSFEFEPSPPSLVFTGSNRVDNNHCPADFSGEILAVERGRRDFDGP